jgi:hypothetical protein
MLFKVQGLILALILLSACSPRPEGGPTRSVYIGDRRIAYYFQQGTTAWDIYRRDNDAALFRIHEGALEGAVVANRGYIWSLNHETHDNVIINATVRQSQGAFGNGFGVICRADENGNGYYFLLASTGEFTISVGTSDRSALFQLVPWQRHNAVKQGYLTNEIRAVCVDNYLAMFVNDVFVGEAFDDEFTEGQLGVAVGAVGQTAWVRFDDILIRDAFMAGKR